MTSTPALSRLAGVLAVLALAGAAALPVIAALVWFFLPDLVRGAGAEAGVRVNPDALTLGVRAAGFVVALTGALIQAAGLLFLRRTFLEAAAGRALSLRAVVNFRRFAWIAVIMVIVAVAQNAAYGAIFSAADPSQPGRLSISFGSNEIKALFTGALFVFAAHVFAAGRRAEEENASFV